MLLKDKKISFLGLQILLTGLWYSKFAPKPFVRSENAVTRAHGSCSLRVMGFRQCEMTVTVR